LYIVRVVEAESRLSALQHEALVLWQIIGLRLRALTRKPHFHHALCAVLAWTTMKSRGAALFHEMPLRESNDRAHF
jgi:hypothetical protein